MRTYVMSAHTHIHAEYTHRMPPAMHLSAYMHYSTYTDTKRILVFTRYTATQCCKR